MTPRFRNRREEFEARPRLSPWQRIPRHHRILGIVLVLGVLGAAFRGELVSFFEWLQPAVARIRLVDASGAGIPLSGRADVFELDRSTYRPSPMPCLGSIALDGVLAGAAECLELDGQRFPRSLQIRFHVPGYGVDFVSVELGRRREPFTMRLGPPVDVQGVVTDNGQRPVADARVIALGGNARGVVLAEARTDSNGVYVLSTISRHIDYLTLRILKEGYAMAEREYWLDAAHSEKASRTDFRIVPAPPVLGTVRLPAGVSAADLRISVAQLAGVSAVVGEDGEFVLHNLDPVARYRLLVQGLPEGFTQLRCQAQAGSRVLIDVVPAVTLRGQVISTHLGRGLKGVEVWHANSCRDQERCVTDDYGRFRLRSVPVGDVWLTVAPPSSHLGGRPSDQFVAVEADAAFRASIRIQ